MPTEICNEMGKRNSVKKYEFLSDFNYLNNNNLY